MEKAHTSTERSFKHVYFNEFCFFVEIQFYFIVYILKLDG